MRLRQILTVLGLTAALASTATAQFAASGPGSPVPASGSGGGGSWPNVLPPSPGISTASVGVAVTNIDSIVIDGYLHSWIGDTMATLSDPSGNEHLIYVRPGSINGSFGNSGDFTGGQYTFVESGSSSLPTSGNAPAGTYNQSFNTGAGTSWNSGTAGVFNTPLSMISGPAGNWTLRIYDWAGGDTGSFSGFTLYGNGGGPVNQGVAYCFGDGSGAACPCGAFGATGAGCLTTSGTGATLVGTGDADVSSDSFVMTVTGGPANKPGIFFHGVNQVFLPIADGILCSNATKRYDVNPLDSTGAATQSGFGAFASSAVTLNYQYWFRDPGNPCGGGFNFSNGWVVTWL